MRPLGTAACGNTLPHSFVSSLKINNIKAEYRKHRACGCGKSRADDHEAQRACVKRETADQGSPDRRLSLNAIDDCSRIGKACLQVERHMDESSSISVGVRLSRDASVSSMRFKPLAIRTGPLKPSRVLHFQPIDLVVYEGPSHPKVPETLSCGGLHA